MAELQERSEQEKKPKKGDSAETVDLIDWDVFFDSELESEED